MLSSEISIAVFTILLQRERDMIKMNLDFNNEEQFIKAVFFSF